jgi:hypothetical protein
MDHSRSLKTLMIMPYKIDLSGEYGVSATFNIFYLYLFDVGDDLRFSPFDERKDNAIQTTPKDSLEFLVGFKVKKT